MKSEKIKHWEISGNLDDPHEGINNYDTFRMTICATKDYFDKIFGVNLLDSIDFLVDNATANSGYTPITTPILKRFIIIKLGIYDGNRIDQTIFQFAHELTHLVFYAYYGLEKPFADQREESICTAASLIALRVLCPESFLSYVAYVKNLSDEKYRDGARIAEEINYDMKKLKIMIEPASEFNETSAEIVV